MRAASSAEIAQGVISSTDDAGQSISNVQTNFNDAPRSLHSTAGVSASTNLQAGLGLATAAKLEQSEPPPTSTSSNSQVTVPGECGSSMPQASCLTVDCSSGADPDAAEEADAKRVAGRHPVQVWHEVIVSPAVDPATGR